MPNLKKRLEMSLKQTCQIRQFIGLGQVAKEDFISSGTSFGASLLNSFPASFTAGVSLHGREMTISFFVIRKQIKKILNTRSKKMS